MGMSRVGRFSSLHCLAVVQVMAAGQLDAAQRQRLLQE
ncbi:hypothetical protein BRI6_3258 [plant metagenome]